MAEYRTIRMALWTDPYIESLEPHEKLLYIYLFTNPHTNNLGVMEVSRRRMAFETGLEIKELSATLAKMEKAGKLMVDVETVWLVNFIRHQTSTSPKMVQSLRGIVDSVQSSKIRRAICERYPHVFDGCNTPPIPYADGIRTPPIPIREEEEERELEEEVGTGRDTPPSPPLGGAGHLDATPSQQEHAPEPALQPQAPDPPPKRRTPEWETTLPAMVIAAYHELLPEMPTVQSPGSVKQAILARAKDKQCDAQERAQRQDVAWWRSLFTRIRGMPFLMGEVQTQDGRPFSCSLAWITGRNNLGKILNGNYAPRDGPKSTGSSLTDRNLRVCQEWLREEGVVQ